MAAPYESAEISAVDFQGNYENCCHAMSDFKAKMRQNCVCCLQFEEEIQCENLHRSVMLCV